MQRDINSAYYDDIGYTSYSDPRLQPSDNEYEEEDSIEEAVEIPFDTVVQIEPGGMWDYVNPDYAAWLDIATYNGKLYSNEYSSVKLDDVDGIADKIGDLLDSYFPVIPGVYRIQGVATLTYLISDIYYDPNYDEYLVDDVDIDYLYKQSSVDQVVVSSK